MRVLAGYNVARFAGGDLRLLLRSSWRIYGRRRRHSVLQIGNSHRKSERGKAPLERELVDRYMVMVGPKKIHLPTPFDSVDLD
jgi:hypothetical protein